ncbi:Addiction module toxin RelE [Pseudomonas sp. IT-P171]|uniref:type II toxin-antitoxin system RelE/ParE family toxin n=1 Tax=Pseudomonas sp. IT-P171 TaxID=3026453 RepID=UPI0039DF8876
MGWEVEYTDEFEGWWDRLNEAEQDSVQATVMLLGDEGPHLGFPYTSDIKGSRHGNLRELRVQHAGRPYRVLYAFDPRRCAILLIGGDKTGHDRWYLKHVPLAERLYDEHLETLKNEGYDNG